MKHYLDYKGGAVLVLNHNIETDVINTKEKLMAGIDDKKDGQVN
jgi:hypothetical protein